MEMDNPYHKILKYNMSHIQNALIHKSIRLVKSRPEVIHGV